MKCDELESKDYNNGMTAYELMEENGLVNTAKAVKEAVKEACDRLQTANLIKDEQKAKADKLLSCLKYLVMRDLIKDCPAKKVVTEIVKEYDSGLR